MSSGGVEGPRRESSDSPFVKEHFGFTPAGARQEISKGGLLPKETQASNSLIHRAFAFLSGFFASRAEKKTCIQACMQRVNPEIFQRGVIKKTSLEKALSSLSLRELRTLQSFFEGSVVPIETYQGLLAQPKLFRLILVSAETKTDSRFMDSALAVLNASEEKLSSPTSSVEEQTQARNELRMLKLALKIDLPTTHPLTKLKAHAELRALSSKTPVNEHLAKVIHDVTQQVIANPKTTISYKQAHEKLLPASERPRASMQTSTEAVERALKTCSGQQIDAFKEHPQNFDNLVLSLVSLNELCHGGLALEAQTELAKIFLTDLKEVAPFVEGLKACCKAMDSATNYEEREEATARTLVLLSASKFSSQAPVSIKSFGMLLVGRHVLINTQLVDAALGRLIDNQATGASRLSPEPVYDSGKSEMFRSSSLRGQIHPNKEGDTDIISILITDSCTHTSVCLEIPLPRHENGTPLSDKQKAQLLKCQKAGLNQLGQLTGVDDDIKALASTWIARTEELYARALKEVQLPERTAPARSNDQLFDDIQLGRVYARQGEQLALTQATPRVHPECTVIQPKTLRQTDSLLFDKKSQSFKDSQISVTLQTLEGPIDIQLKADSRVDDHGVSFYVLTSTTPNGETETSYFMREKKDGRLESDQTMHKRMIQERFLEHHLLISQALCIKSKGRRDSFDSGSGTSSPRSTPTTPSTPF